LGQLRDESGCRGRKSVCSVEDLGGDKTIMSPLGESVRKVRFTTINLCLAGIRTLFRCRPEDLIKPMGVGLENVNGGGLSQQQRENSCGNQVSVF